MPGFDLRGPLGQGPMTGRQRGMCRGTDTESFSGFARGQGGGFGLRRGFGNIKNQRNRFENTPANDSGPETGTASELASLKMRYQAAIEMLDAMTERIAVLETRK